jgi:NADPH-dependent 2,4-dienoyl-CoA reductase/sulfur reductase-like enzyme
MPISKSQKAGGRAHGWPDFPKMVPPAATFMQVSHFLGNEMTKEADAIVIGSGINGLVAAAELAQAGWSVILVERNAKIGGFIATEERTLPGYLHDTFSSWHPQFVTGPAYATLGQMLHQHGLEYRNIDNWVTASVADDGRVTLRMIDLLTGSQSQRR